MSTHQAGVRPYRLEWVAETAEGVTPEDPDYNLYSDNVTSAPGWEPDANTTRQNAAGEVTAQGFFNGSETHDVTYTYSLQQWYVDGSDETLDAGGDFLQAASDNSLQATHSIVGRSVQADGGAADAGRRIYTVVKGAHPDSLTAPFETEDGSPIEQELAYQAEKVRQYDISQPAESTTLWIQSTDSSDDSQDVTIEDEGSDTSESNGLSGTTAVETTVSYGDIDAIELSAETVGNVEVYDGDPGMDGTLLATIYGSDHYPADEGDLGVPALDSGSHASALDSEYVRFIDDTLSIPNVESDVEIISGEMSVETGLGDNSKSGSARRNIHAAEWTYTITATLAGSKVSVDQFNNYLGEVTGEIVWTAGEGSITFNDCFIQSPGEYTKESGNGKMQFDNEWQAQSVEVSN